MYSNTEKKTKNQYNTNKMSVQSNLLNIRKHIPGNVDLVCVSKFHPNDSILDAYHAGERIFGESKVQELCTKYESLPKDIQWHYIGHLQSNKVKYIVPFVELIHGVDSIKLLSEIDKQAAKVGRKVNCLLQVHIATEETKFGFSPEEITTALEKGGEFENVQIRGLMGMATFTDNTEQVKNEFRLLKSIFDELKSHADSEFTILSMGMSDDFRLAIEEGSTMVRIGSSIFGNRNYV